MNVTTDDTAADLLKAAIQDGIDSGVSDKKVPDIMREVDARLAALDELSGLDQEMNMGY